MHVWIPASCAQKPQRDFYGRQSFTGVTVGLQLSSDGSDGRIGEGTLKVKSRIGSTVGACCALLPCKSLIFITAKATEWDRLSNNSSSLHLVLLKCSNIQVYYRKRDKLVECSNQLCEDMNMDTHTDTQPPQTHTTCINQKSRNK